MVQGICSSSHQYALEYSSKHISHVQRPVVLRVLRVGYLFDHVHLTFFISLGTGASYNLIDLRSFSTVEIINFISFDFVGMLGRSIYLLHVIFK